MVMQTAIIRAFDTATAQISVSELRAKKMRANNFSRAHRKMDLIFIPRMHFLKVENTFDLLR